MTYELPRLCRLGRKTQGIPRTQRHFGGPKIPKPQAPAAPAVVEDKAVQDATADAIRRRSTSRGFRSTVLRNMMNPADTSAASGSQSTLGA